MSIVEIVLWILLALAVAGFIWRFLSFSKMKPPKAPEKPEIPETEISEEEILEAKRRVAELRKKLKEDNPQEGDLSNWGLYLLLSREIRLSNWGLYLLLSQEIRSEIYKLTQELRWFLTFQTAVIGILLGLIISRL